MGHLEVEETKSACRQFFFTTAGMGNLLLASRADCVVVLDTGATANLVCFSWLERHNRLLEHHSLQRVSVYQSEARFRFGDGRVGEVRRAADITAGSAGN